jgi:diguanylate cyclase (GGDEF)-like protein
MAHETDARTALWPFVLALAAVVSAPLLVASTGLASASAQSDWLLIRPMPVVTLQIRKVAGYTLLFPAGTLFLLYLFRPRPYVLAAVSSWLAAGAMLLALSFDSTDGGVLDSPAHLVSGRLAVAAWAVAALAFGASVRFSGTWFRRPASVPGIIRWTTTATVIWIGVAVLFLQPAAVMAPALILTSLFQAKGAVAYFHAARQYRFVGALLAGLGVSGVILVNAATVVMAIATRDLSQVTSVAFGNFISVAIAALGMHLLIFEDVIEELRTAGAALSESRDEMRTMAVTDPLTRCYNRRFLEEIATHELEQHRRYQLPLSLLYIDIDHFKAINDTRGHYTGDRVLQVLGSILRTHTRQADYVLRWGGDEFLVLLSADGEQAVAKGHEIRQAFLDSPIVKDLPAGVDLSIGCVAVPPETKDFAPLIDQADREMYRRKRALG